MVVELRMYYCGELFRIHLRRFYGVYLCSKSVHSISKILKDFPFWRDTFEHRFLKNYFMTTKKCNKIIISCLWTDWKNKSFCNVSLFANIFRDIPQILLNRRHLKCLKKSAHIFLNMKKFNIMMKRKQLIMIYWQISIEKYVPKHPISLIKIFCNISSLLND